MLDIGELNISGLQGAYGTTERFLGNHPNTLYAFSKAMAEGVVLSKRDSALAKKAIGKFAKVDDSKILDASYDAYAPYIETNLVRDQVIRAELGYLDPKEFPQAKNANPRDFFDNSFVESLEKSVSSRRSAWADEATAATQPRSNQRSSVGFYPRIHLPWQSAESDPSVRIRPATCRCLRRKPLAHQHWRESIFRFSISSA